MTWDPTGSLRRALWIGGGQWAGKSTVANLLAERHGLTAYHYDYHDARGHQDRWVARRCRNGEPTTMPDAEELWLGDTVAGMAGSALERFRDRFDWTLDDLRALASGRPLVAEGWGLRPELVAPLLDAPDRMVVMVPTAEFREHQTRVVPRAAAPHGEFSDPARAQRNRLARDAMLADDAVRAAHRLGIRVLEVDGSRDAAAMADEVAGHFAAYL